MTAPRTPLALPEFVGLIALMTSIIALAIDIMLPALDAIGRDLAVDNPNDAQLVVSSLFLGYAAGQLVAGPLSDSYGRKPVIYAGYAIFTAGCLMSMFATGFEVMLAGRMLQGIGAAAPRIVPMALVRDGYEGRAMARIMSFVMAVFILVPAVAPALGQGIIHLAGWRATFAFLLLVAAIALVWFAVRQPETLPEARRRKFSLASILGGIAEACRHRRAVGYTLGAGLVFSPFIGYLSSAQQVFTVTYGTGDLFPAFFACGAAAIGLASVVNSKLVMRLGMRHLSIRALAMQAVVSSVFLAVVLPAGGVPPLWAFMVWMMASFFCIGILFGNFNALAMEPLGHMAGLGAALIGSVSTLVSLPFGWAVGHAFDGTVTALVAGFALFGWAALGTMVWTERGAPHTDA